MATTNVGVPISQFKRTKIIVTIGPALDSYESIKRVIELGANGLRLNFTHGTHEERVRQIAWIRRASEELHKPVAILQDLQGPSLRLGNFEGLINVSEGQDLAFAYDTDFEKTGIIPLQHDLLPHLKRGERIYINDGKVRLSVTSLVNGVIRAKAENDGILIRHKNINVPDSNFDAGTITEKDLTDLAFSHYAEFDYVCLPLVQTDQDVINWRKHLRILGSKARVLAKIETKAAVDNLETILREADGAILGRGDLAVENGFEALPTIERYFIKLGQQLHKPVIVATQLLESLVDSTTPTRSEVSDIGALVSQGVDGLLLSDETAIGHHPNMAVELLKNTILFTEHYLDEFDCDGVPEDKTSAIGQTITVLASQVDAKAIIAETKSGATAQLVSSYRPLQPILAVTPTAKVAQQLAIIYGVKAYMRDLNTASLTRLSTWLIRQKIIKSGDLVIMASGKRPGVVGATDTIKVRMLE